MTNVSQINKAKRLTEEEVHEAAEELKESGIRPSSIEVYKFLGRGSLTTITNFLKTWSNPDEKTTTTLPALIMLPDALKKSAEQLILKVWAESQDLAEHEINSQREALKQAEALANEKIAEAEAFSEEQSKQIEALEAKIEELKKEKTKDQDYFLTEEKRLQKEIANGQKSEGILETRIFNTEKQLKAANEKIHELETIIEKSKKFEIKASVQEEKINELKIKLEQEDKRSQLHMKDNEKLREKAAKLEGELIAWKKIKPETKKPETKKRNAGRNVANQNKLKTESSETGKEKFKQTEWTEEKTSE